jgi:5-deoxy-D-glucuronate isomerase
VIDGRRTWEEVFFCLIEPERALIPKGMGFAMMRMDGVFYDGKHVNESRLIHNGDALVTPLGSHPIVVAPNHRLWYFWGYYGNALAKTYNVWADDVGTYVK